MHERRSSHSQTTTEKLSGPTKEGETVLLRHSAPSDQSHTLLLFFISPTLLLIFISHSLDFPSKKKTFFLTGTFCTINPLTFLLYHKIFSIIQLLFTYFASFFLYHSQVNSKGCYHVLYEWAIEKEEHKIVNYMIIFCKVIIYFLYNVFKSRL